MPTLEEQIENLKHIGIKIREPFTVDTLLTMYDRSDFEEKPYSNLLAAMGGECEEEPHDYISDKIWHFDTECIEDHGAYIRIAEHMSVLASGDLPLKNIQDYVDVEEEMAWLSFVLDGKSYRLEAEVDNDWVDSAILCALDGLLVKRKTGKRFIYGDLQGQDFLMACGDAAFLLQLQQVTGLPFQWLCSEE